MSDIPEQRPGGPPPPWREPVRVDGHQAIADVAERERAYACSVLTALPGNWSYYARRGNPAQMLSAIADDHDASMIVLGAPRHGLASLVERLLGESVASRLIHHGTRPVLLVPERSHAWARPAP
ncbi:universal stress protein [Nocardia cyriacigeorgica]|uniref:universal stress protein n=1 Tax=Nocardia cyriacigeorgica TaxID=135487 RepID=UPI002458D344|nr:universal stress protein [Nocardia cyriacigeorgica]